MLSDFEGEHELALQVGGGGEGGVWADPQQRGGLHGDQVRRVPQPGRPQAQGRRSEEGRHIRHRQPARQQDGCQVYQSHNFLNFNDNN
jgi:hypothetical protein